MPECLAVFFTALEENKDFGKYERSLNQETVKEFLNKVDDWLEPGVTYLLTIEKADE